MSVKSWKVPVGLFSSARNWSPSGAPAAGDTLSIQSGAAIIRNRTFGAEGVQTSIGLTGPDAENPPLLAAYNTAFKDVDINNAPPPGAGSTGGPYHGRLLAVGTVTNDGGTILAGGGQGFNSSIDITVAPGSTLVNKGSIGAGTGCKLTIAGYGGSTVENDGNIFSASGTVKVSTALTGTGAVSVSGGALGGAFGGRLELDAPAGDGQTFGLSRAVLQLDQPLSFMGQVSANPSNGGGRVDLEGLSAASWAVNGSSVELFDAAGSLVDAVRFTTPQDAGALAVFATTDPTYGSVVSIGSGGGFGAPTPDALLPYHAAPAAAA